MDLTSIITWIIFGAIIGAIARFIMPGRDPMGWVGTIVLGIVGAIVVHLGPGGEILLINRQCERVTGHRSAGVAGRQMEDVLLPASARSLFRNAFRGALAGEIQANVEYPLLTTSGEMRLVVWSHPAFAQRCIFARNDRKIVCVSLAR